MEIYKITYISTPTKHPSETKAVYIEKKNFGPNMYVSNFVSISRKLDNPYYHIVEYRWCLREELAKAALDNFVR